MTFLTSIFKKIVSRLSPGTPNAGSETVFVAAFGKHPGWDDHIDDIGLQTDVFVNVKRLLYVQGIGGNIDSGSWDKLQANQLIKEFKHAFVWCMDNDVIVGRIWSSRDGKGRTSYPMIVCVHCRQLPLEWVLKNILSRLERIEERCVAATSAPDVHMIIENAQNELRQLARQCQSSGKSPAAHADALARLADYTEMGPNREGLLRILYHIEREVERYRPDPTKTKEFRPTFLRIPGSPPDWTQSVLLWIGFLLTRLGSATPMLLLMPLRYSWIDVIIGDPTEVQLYCLRASLDVIPLTTSIPYNMGSEFIERANQLIEDSRRVAVEQIANDIELS